MAMSARAGSAFLVGSYQRYLSATSHGHTVPTCVSNRFIGDTVVLVLPTGQKSIRDGVLRVDLRRTGSMLITRYQFALPRGGAQVVLDGVVGRVLDGVVGRACAGLRCAEALRKVT